MRWSGGDLDGDTLEPLEPGSEETLPGYGPTGARLTTARELVERLSRMADEPTGLTIGASPAARLHTVGSRLVVVDAGRAKATLLEGSRLVGAPTPTAALVMAPDGFMVTAAGGGLEPGARFRNVRRDIRAGTNGVYAAALDDRGRVLLARVDGARGRGFRFSALRPDLPKLVDVAVLP